MDVLRANFSQFLLEGIPFGGGGGEWTFGWTGRNGPDAGGERDKA